MNDKSTSFRNKGYICTAKKKADDSVSRLNGLNRLLAMKPIVNLKQG